MRGAPPAAVNCGDGATWRGVQAGLYALTAGVVVAWGAVHAGLAAAVTTTAVSLAAVTVGVAAWRSLGAPSVRLTWDGERWTVSPGDEAGRVEVMIDLGAWLLLRFLPERPAMPKRWLAVSAAAGGASMHGFRAAVCCRPSQTIPRVRSPERQPD